MIYYVHRPVEGEIRYRTSREVRNCQRTIKRCCFFANATEPHSSDGFMPTDSCWENELYVKCKRSIWNMLLFNFSWLKHEYWIFGIVSGLVQYWTGLAVYINSRINHLVRPQNFLKTYYRGRVKGFNIGPSKILWKAAFKKYTSSILEYLDLFIPPIRTLTCAYQVVRNVSLSEHFVYILNGSIHQNMLLLNRWLDLNFFWIVTKNTLKGMWTLMKSRNCMS